MNAQTICRIVQTEFDLNENLAKMAFQSTGAVVMFTGLVRGVSDRDFPHETLALTYDAYQPMAEKMMNRIADEIRARWPEIESITIIQRIGKLAPGNPSVLIACSAAHRDTGVFDAVRYGIDRLKEIVPVWKKELQKDGETWIEGEFIPQPSDI
jgi:molybdopterin synthase catalytic subunit